MDILFETFKRRYEIKNLEKRNIDAHSQTLLP